MHAAQTICCQNRNKQDINSKLLALCKIYYSLALVYLHLFRDWGKIWMLKLNRHISKRDDSFHAIFKGSNIFFSKALPPF